MRKNILLIFLVAFFLRLALFLGIASMNYPEGFYVYDSWGYQQIAINLQNSGIFSQDYTGELNPDYFRTPLFPLFILGNLALGVHPWLTIFLQLIISSFTCVIVFQIALSLKLHRRVALLAGLLTAIEPGLICFSNLLLTETLFSFFFTLSILYLIRYLNSDKRIDLLVFSISIALSVLARPIAVYLAFVIFPILFFIRRTSIKTLATGVMAFILVLSPWFIRTGIQFGRPFLTKLDDHMLLFYHASSIVAEEQGITLQEAQNSLWTQAINSFDGDPKKQVNKFSSHVRDQATLVIRNNVKTYMKQHAYGVVSIMFKPVRGYFDQQLALIKGYQFVTPGEFPASPKMVNAFMKTASFISMPLVVLQLLILTFCYLFLIPGFKVVNTHNLYAGLLFILLLIYFFNMVVPPFSEGRMRIPVFPILAVLGSAGFFAFLEKRKKKAAL